MPKKKNSRAAQGSGSIRQRPDGRWEARLTYKDAMGQTKRASVYGATQKEVRQKLTAATKQADEGIYTKPKRITVQEWMKEWLEVYCVNLKPNTIVTYQSRIEKDIDPYIGTVYLAQLQTPQIQRLINTLASGDEKRGRKPLSAKTVVCVHGILHRAFQQAKAIRLIPENPAENITLPKIKKPELKPLMDDSLSSFLEVIKGSRFERVYLLALFTGLRQSEIIGLQWGDIDWEAGTITVTRQRQRKIKDGGGYRMVDSAKNGKSRKVTASPSVLKYLKEERRQQSIHRLAAGKYWDNPDDFVFTDELGTPIKHEAVYREFKKLVKSIGMEDTRFHDLRHPYVKLRLKNLEPTFVWFRLKIKPVPSKSLLFSR